MYKERERKKGCIKLEQSLIDPIYFKRDRNLFISSGWLADYLADCSEGSWLASHTENAKCAKRIRNISK